MTTELLIERDWEYDQDMFPPYRGYIRCLSCDETFTEGEGYLDHLDDGPCATSDG